MKPVRDYDDYTKFVNSEFSKQKYHSRLIGVTYFNIGICLSLRRWNSEAITPTHFLQ